MTTKSTKSRISKKALKNCKRCNIEFRGAKNRLFCGTTCKAKALGTGKEETNISLSTGTLGAISELLVSSDLMLKGYEVYRALSPSSFCDILAMKGDAIIRFEIRTGQYYVLATGERKMVYCNSRTEGKNVAVVTHLDNKIHYVDFEP